MAGSPRVAFLLRCGDVPSGCVVALLHHTQGQGCWGGSLRAAAPGWASWDGRGEGVGLLLRAVGHSGKRLSAFTPRGPEHTAMADRKEN